MTIQGNLTNNGTFDMYGGANTRICNVTFAGNINRKFSGTAVLANTEFSYLTINKGTSRNTVLDVNVLGLTLSGNGSGAPLVLTNGTFKVDTTTLDITLSTTNVFSIPSTACLSVNQGIVRIGTNNDAGDLSLAGRLEVLNTGTVNIGNGANNNNDIEYLPAGLPEIIVGGNGILNVTARYAD